MWYWPNGTTSPTWVTPSLTTACTTATGPTIWWTNTVTTPTGTASTLSVVQDRAWLAQAYGQTEQWYSHRAQHEAHMQAMADNERYQFALYRPLGLGQAFAPAAPALITHQEQARADQELYRRAVAEHDQQEAARLLRMIEDRERTHAERQRLQEQQAQIAREQQQQHAAARDRARELLLEHLSPAQRETFIANGWFVVEGGRSKTRYRIRSAGAAGNIDVLDRRDRTTHRLCCHAASDIPLGDQWLAQKIMLELAEDDFLRIANRQAA